MKDWISNLTSLGKTGIYTAVLSCLIGIAITLAFLITQIESLMLVGIIYIYSAVFANSIVLILLIYSLIFRKQNRKKEFPVSLLMLLNIPISFMCLYLAINSIHISGLD